MPDNHGNEIAQEGCDRCFCGCKYWEHDKCIDCGTTAQELHGLRRAVLTALPADGTSHVQWDHPDYGAVTRARLNQPERTREEALADIGLGDFDARKVEFVCKQLVDEDVLWDGGSYDTVGYYQPTEESRNKQTRDEKDWETLEQVERVLEREGLLVLNQDYRMTCPKPSLGKYVALELPAILTLLEKAGIKLWED